MHYLVPPLLSPRLVATGVAILPYQSGLQPVRRDGAVPSSWQLHSGGCFAGGPSGCPFPWHSSTLHAVGRLGRPELELATKSIPRRAIVFCVPALARVFVASRNADARELGAGCIAMARARSVQRFKTVPASYVQWSVDGWGKGPSVTRKVPVGRPQRLRATGSILLRGNSRKRLEGR